MAQLQQPEETGKPGHKERPNQTQAAPRPALWKDLTEPHHPWRSHVLKFLRALSVSNTFSCSPADQPI